MWKSIILSAGVLLSTEALADNAVNTSGAHVTLDAADAGGRYCIYGSQLFSEGAYLCGDANIQLECTVWEGRAKWRSNNTACK